MENDLSELSMGMSGDFEMAVRFGATYVRVGQRDFRGPQLADLDFIARLQLFQRRQQILACQGDTAGGGGIIGLAICKKIALPLPG